LITYVRKHFYFHFEFYFHLEFFLNTIMCQKSLYKIFCYEKTSNPQRSMSYVFSNIYKSCNEILDVKTLATLS
jgi:hypothetical protein